MKYVVLPIVGIFIKVLSFIMVGILALSAFVFYMFNKTDIVYPEHKVVHLFTKNEEAFETVRQFVDDVDFSGYPVAYKATPYVSISSPDPLPDIAEYKVRVTTDQMYQVDVDEEKVNQALDQLFRKSDITYISQTRNEEFRSVYFYIANGVGVVYSRTGQTPEDYVDDMYYEYERISDNWFYWRGTWPD